MPIYIEPQATDAPVISFIEKAKGPLVVDNYFISDRNIVQAIRARVEAGGDTLVILEPKPYGMSRSAVAREYAELKETGANVIDAPERFANGHAFDHAKYAVSGNEALIGTANWSFAGFSRNCEYLYITSDPVVVNALQQVAIADANGRADQNPSPPNLIISPQPDVVSKLQSVINQPGPVGIETEEVQPDNPLNQTLAAKGSLAYMIIPDKLSDREMAVVNGLRQDGVHIRTISVPYMHAKLIVGGTEVFLGSQNFSATSLEANREIGIILSKASHPGGAQELTDQFNADWRAASEDMPTSSDEGERSDYSAPGY